MKNNRPKTLLISSNYAWTVYNFRLGLIRRLKQKGYRIIILTQFDGFESHLIKEVDEVKSLFISRKGINPFEDMITMFHFIKSIMVFKPDALLLFTVKPVIYGSLAARLTKVKSIAMITGLGTAFISDSWITKMVKTLYRVALKSSSTTFFQNVNDKDLFLKNRMVKKNIWKITPGSGIDLNQFKYIDLPDESELIFLFVGRMLGDKGVREFVNAARVINTKYSHIRFQILGPAGAENRTAISDSEIEKWTQEGVVEYLGETDDVTDFLRKASCIVLPSYREGTSKALLEGAAAGRPLVATNVPGCKEIIEDGKTGFLCQVRDYKDLAIKIENMIKLSHKSRQMMGKHGRKKVEKEYDQEIVSNLYLEAIESAI